jgi:hypothetical protein
LDLWESAGEPPVGGTSALLKSISVGCEPRVARPLRRHNDRRGLEVRGIVDARRSPTLRARSVRPRVIEA